MIAWLGSLLLLRWMAGGQLAGLRVLVWGGEGRIRVSPHVHCDGDDVNRFFEALDRVGARPGQAVAAR